MYAGPGRSVQCVYMCICSILSLCYMHSLPKCCWAAPQPKTNACISRPEGGRLDGGCTQQNVLMCWCEQGISIVHYSARHHFTRTRRHSENTPFERSPTLEGPEKPGYWERVLLSRTHHACLAPRACKSVFAYTNTHKHRHTHSAQKCL